MNTHLPNNAVSLILIGVGVLAVWYVYQVLSRAKKEAAFRVRRALVGLPVYFIAATVLRSRGAAIVEAVLVGGLAGLGAGWLFVKAPRRDRRIPKRVRSAVIERDLTRKGLKWDSTKHHIDHVVPFSRGGDNSARNLRVTEKHKNLAKGKRMPKFGDFLK